jgi:hypothetical protein
MEEEKNGERVKPLSPLGQARATILGLDNDLRVLREEQNAFMRDTRAVLASKNQSLTAMEEALTDLRSQLEAKEAELKKSKEDAQYKAMYEKSYSDLKKETDVLHGIFDSLGVPKKEGYTEFSLAARLFAWREGIKAPPKSPE